ncbi:MAG: DUF2065 domain-containing protein [Gammaproteobacteria bacterium]|jgi:uncharacterized protein YjeT (DUF2065 family)|nr:DUF2065 domain-containing protein [Gammaproteobacteria bacterium]
MPGLIARAYGTMNWEDLFSAMALVLVIEGLLPFAAPGSLKKTLAGMLALGDGALRLMGLSSMLLGLVILYFVRG